MHKTKNCIQDCKLITKHEPYIKNGGVSRVIVHSLSFERSKPPLHIADKFLDATQVAMRYALTDLYSPGYYSKGTIPHTFLVRKNGAVDQLLPIRATTNHTLTWRVPGVSIAIVGDFNIDSPGVTQWRSAIALCACLTKAFETKIIAHDAIPDTRADVHKRCPGALWDMKEFTQACRMTAYGFSRREARDLLTSSAEF